MPRTDPRVDAYIDRAADFAKPILKYIRTTVHAACPDCEETMKWSFPHFMYKGMLCSMASFKEHCAFGFWKGALLEEGGTKICGLMPSVVPSNPRGATPTIVIDRPFTMIV